MNLEALTLTALLAVTAPTCGWAEIVTTLDGRQFDLKADGTYEAVDVEVAETAAISEFTAWLKHVTDDYGRQKIHFMPRFANESDKVIVGTKFTSVFENAFGDEVLTFSGETSERVEPRQTSSALIYYVFENNQFIPDEPYDKLLPIVMNKTGKVRTEFTHIAFSDGTVISPE